MAKLAYAVSGEGRGHAARARTLVEDLGVEHEVLLYAPGQAYEMLAPCAREGRVEVRAMPGLRFRYSARHRLDYLATGAGSLGYLRRFPSLIRRVRRELESFEPDAVLCDFEPSLPRASMCGPWLAVCMRRPGNTIPWANCRCPCRPRR